jgi:hypothetical protein
MARPARKPAAMAPMARPSGLSSARLLARRAPPATESVALEALPPTAEAVLLTVPVRLDALSLTVPVMP